MVVNEICLYYAIKMLDVMDTILSFTHIYLPLPSGKKADVLNLIYRASPQHKEQHEKILSNVDIIARTPSGCVCSA